jgi:hypothetical protein
MVRRRRRRERGRAGRGSRWRWAEWVFGGERFVDVDAEAGLTVAVEVAFADFGGAGKDLVDRGRGKWFSSWMPKAGLEISTW